MQLRQLHFKSNVLSCLRDYLSSQTFNFSWDNDKKKLILKTFHQPDSQVMDRNTKSEWIPIETETLL